MSIVPAPLPRVTLDRSWAVGRPLIGCRFDPTGRFLFASAEDNSIRRLDLLTGAVASFTEHASWVRGMVYIAHVPAALAETAACERRQASVRAAGGSMAISVPTPKPSPLTAVSGDYHGKLIWWNAAEPKPVKIRSVDAHDGWIRAVAVSPDGQTIASCGNDHLVKLWSVSSGQLIRTLTGHASHVYNVVFHPHGKQLASCDLKGIVKIWELSGWKEIKQLDAAVLYKYDPGFMADIGGARGMAFDSSGRLACCGITNVSNAFAGVGNPIVVTFDANDGKPKSLKPVESFQGTAWGVAFHPAGFIVAAGGGSGGRIWLWSSNEPLQSRSANVPTNARDLALHPVGDRLAVAGGNGSAYLYSIRSPQRGTTNMSVPSNRIV
jgi:WD40 repeat protein